MVVVVVVGAPPLKPLPYQSHPPAAQQHDGQSFMRKEEEKAAHPLRPCHIALPFFSVSLPTSSCHPF